ncbi:MAG: RDD family protein, partial [Acaryochloridaceae cyanobacterium RU_4_10]|nr:RDD family protein [Acaryochloridaceae cyanobacterium RU_4_10]
MKYFNRITLQTPESVELEFILAGIGSRILALLIDYTLLGLFLLALVLFWAFFSYQLVVLLDSLNINYSGLQNWLIAIPLLIGFAGFVGYFVF